MGLALTYLRAIKSRVVCTEDVRGSLASGITPPAQILIVAAFLWLAPLAVVSTYYLMGDMGAGVMLDPGVLLDPGFRVPRFSFPATCLMAVVVVVGGLWLMRVAPRPPLEPASGFRRVPDASLMLLVLTLIGLIVNAGVQDDRVPAVSSGYGAPAFCLIFFVALVLTQVFSHRNATERMFAGRVQTIVILIPSLALTAWSVAPLLQLNGGLTDEFHRVFVINELGSVTTGHYPGWDYMSQYSLAFPYLVALGSIVTGLALAELIPLVVTATNCALLLIVFLLVKGCGARAPLALVLTGFVSLPWAYTSPGGGNQGIGSYWGVDPLRLATIIPLVLAMLLITRPQTPVVVRALGTGVLLAAAVAINAEWGFAVILGLCAVILVQRCRERKNWTWILISVVSIPVGIFTALGIAEGVLGSPLGYFSYLTFIRWAAADGSLQGGPLYALGFHWIVAMTATLAVFVGIVIREKCRDSNDERLVGGLVAIGVYTLVAMSYFFFRPFAPVIVALFLPWGICCALIFLSVIRFGGRGIVRRRKLVLLTMVLIAVIPVGCALYRPSFSYTIDRLSGAQPTWRVSPSLSREQQGLIEGSLSSYVAKRPAGLISDVASVDSEFLGVEQALPLNSWRYLKFANFSSLVCAWLTGRYPAIVFSGSSSLEPVAGVLRCAGYEVVSEATPGWTTWAPLRN
jgi:hypothetical protein